MYINKVVFISGDRAEFELIMPIINKFSQSESYEVILVLCGTHFIADFGNTGLDIINEVDVQIFKIENLFRSDNPIGRLKSFSSLTSSLADIITHVQPDFLCVLGDREESLATATVGSYLRIPIIHVAGGDVSNDGNVDNPVRDAVSKLSHVHWAASEQSAQRLINLGEAPWRVKNIGSTGAERIRNTTYMPRNSLLRKIGISHDIDLFCTLIFHPLLPEYNMAGEQMKCLLEAIFEAGITCFISRSNSDPGREKIKEVQDYYVSRFPDRFIQLGHLSREKFVNLLRHSEFLIGNSSAGIIEVGSLKKPVINVGNRQRGREAGENVIFVNCIKDRILSAIDKALSSTFQQNIANMENPYGNGNSSVIALEHLETLKNDPKKILRKEII